ncbi:cell adhesion molecule DSCAML1-like [Stigmatopora nigra]
MSSAERRKFPTDMNYLIYYFTLFGLLFGFNLAVSLEVKVGADVTLPCKYDVGYYGKLSACWGRGPIPNRGCAGEVISTDGASVSGRLSERYLLAGDIQAGDVSLTIRQVVESDSGLYGCRVQVPGWFNDRKHQISLSVVPGRPDAVKVEAQEVRDRIITVRWSHPFDGGRPIESYRIDLKSKDVQWGAAAITLISNPNLNQVTLVDLRPAKYYELRMFAINSQGTSNASNVLMVATEEAAPDGPPLDMRLQTFSSTSIRVSWKPPRTDLRNGVLQSYSVSYREYDPVGRHFQRWQRRIVPATGAQESLILTGLKPSSQYGVLVQAKTQAGIGPAATAPLCSTLAQISQETMSTLSTVTWLDTTSVFTDPSTQTEMEKRPTVPPDPPVVELKEVKDNTVCLSWTPGFEGDAPISGYFLEYKQINGTWDLKKTVVDFSPNLTEATIVEMNPSTYNIRMFAKSSAGSSQASNVLTFTTGLTGYLQDVFSPATAINTHAATSAEEGGSGHLAAIVVPLVLVLLLIVAMAIAWYLRRMNGKKGNLSLWLSRGAILYRGSESMQEL